FPKVAGQVGQRFGRDAGEVLGEQVRPAGAVLPPDAAEQVLQAEELLAALRVDALDGVTKPELALPAETLERLAQRQQEGAGVARPALAETGVAATERWHGAL